MSAGGRAESQPTAGTREMAIPIPDVVITLSLSLSRRQEGTNSNGDRVEAVGAGARLPCPVAAEPLASRIPCLS